MSHCFIIYSDDFSLVTQVINFIKQSQKPFCGRRIPGVTALYCTSTLKLGSNRNETKRMRSELPSIIITLIMIEGNYK